MSSALFSRDFHLIGKGLIRALMVCSVENFRVGGIRREVSFLLTGSSGSRRHSLRRFYNGGRAELDDCDLVANFVVDDFCH